MIPRRTLAVGILLFGLVVPPLGRGQVWIGPPANPERYYRFATDNGIPGTGRYAYFDYNWPSLRQALDQYGLFGRRYRARWAGAVNVPLAPGHTTGRNAAPAADESNQLNPPRKVKD